MAALSPTSGSFSECDVFLSFRRGDACHDFSSFLHRDLERLGIKVPSEAEEDLWSAEGIEAASLKKIRQSKIAIIVFTEHYADSKWCLIELEEIVKRHKDGRLTILPIFFDVERSNVHFRISFKRSEQMTIEQWKEALRIAGNLGGFELRQVNGNQLRLVELVVDSVSTLLNRQTRVNYDVFLSFRGVDTRNNFTAFLYRELKRVGINVFMDNEGLWVGEEIQSVLLDAIQSSKVSIIVFSENYANSRWCLLELADAVRCHRSNGQKILPLFLNVKPTDVRDLTGNIETSFKKHKDRFDPQTIESWKDALRVVGGKKGIELAQVNGNQSELVDKVVNFVLRGLYRKDWLDEFPM